MDVYGRPELRSEPLFFLSLPPSLLFLFFSFSPSLLLTSELLEVFSISVGASDQGAGRGRVQRSTLGGEPGGR